MSAITLNQERIAHFTSSDIYRLFPSKTGVLTGRNTYIAEKKLEIDYGCCLGTEVYDKVMAWGKLCEVRVNNIIGFDYISTGRKTKEHPLPELKDFWSGSADFENPRKELAAELKCYQRKNFALLTKCLLRAKQTNDPGILKIEFPDEYWQAVSNAMLHGYNKAELMTYMPKFSDLPEIAEIAQDPSQWEGGTTMYDYKFVFDAVEAKEYHRLVFIPETCKIFESLNRYVFDIPKADKELLTSIVISASVELKKYRESLTQTT